MNLVSRIIVAVTAGAFIANLCTPGQAQDAARDAAIHRCIIQAHQQFPDATAESAQRDRTAAYKACMTAAGQAP